MAPEIFDLKTPFYDYRCDMWSVGVVVYALVGGYLPFEGSLKELAVMVTGGEYYFHDEYWTDITREAKNMITGLLQVNPDKRLSAQDALACKWMGLDDEQLSVIDLSTTQQKMRSMTTGKELLKNAVKAVRMTPTGLTVLGLPADATFSLCFVFRLSVPIRWRQ
jgi:serine/threonine protein kinase